MTQSTEFWLGDRFRRHNELRTNGTGADRCYNSSQTYSAIWGTMIGNHGDRGSGYLLYVHQYDDSLSSQHAEQRGGWGACTLWDCDDDQSMLDVDGPSPLFETISVSSIANNQYKTSIIMSNVRVHKAAVRTRTLSVHRYRSIR